MWDWITVADDLQKRGLLFAMVTVVKSNGSTPREAGTKMIIAEDGSLYGTVGGGRLEELATDRGRRCLQRGENEFFEISPDQESGQSCGGESSLLVEVIGAGPRLIIFGAGHVGQAVARIAVDTPFAVSMVDARQEWLQKVPDGVNVSADPDQVVDSTTWGKNHYVVIMTHSHDEDFRILRQMISQNTKYLGVIGSQPKWNLFQKQLREQQVSEEAIQSVTSPIGLKIGGKSPAEVAISLMAELVSIYHGKNG